jgi:hypothetical protein
MYIEIWEIYFIFCIVVCAAVSYYTGWKEGRTAGIEFVLSDLSDSGIITVFDDGDEISVGRYDDNEPRTGDTIEYRDEEQ